MTDKAGSRGRGLRPRRGDRREARGGRRPGEARAGQANQADQANDSGIENFGLFGC